MTREVVLYEIPKIREVARVLDDAVLPAYNDSVKSAYNSDKARAILSKFEKANGELIGSSPFMLVHLQDSGLLPEGSRIATRQDLETALKFDPKIFSGNYIDFGLALRTAGDSYSPNDLLAKNFAGELTKRGIKLKKGKLIPILALTLREDLNSEYGLVFDLKEDIKELEDLAQFGWSYEKQDGLARACLAWGGYWGSGSGSLGILVVMVG